MEECPGEAAGRSVALRPLPSFDFDCDITAADCVRAFILPCEKDLKKTTKFTYFAMEWVSGLLIFLEGHCREVSVGSYAGWGYAHTAGRTLG